AAGMLVLIEHAVWGPLDAAIEEEAETLAGIRDMARGEELRRGVGSVASGPAPGPREPSRGTSGPGGATGQAGGTAPDGRPAAPPAPPSVAITQHATVGRGRHAYRVVWYAADGGGWSEVAVRVGAQVRLLWRARMAIVGGATVLLATFAFLAWAITTRVTAEL